MRLLLGMPRADREKATVDELARLAKLRGLFTHQPVIGASELAVAYLRRWRCRVLVTLQRANVQAFFVCSCTPLPPPPLEDISFVLDPRR